MLTWIKQYLWCPNRAICQRDTLTSYSQHSDVSKSFIALWKLYRTQKSCYEAGITDSHNINSRQYEYKIFTPLKFTSWRKHIIILNFTKPYVVQQSQISQIQNLFIYIIHIQNINIDVYFNFEGVILWNHALACTHVYVYVMVYFKCYLPKTSD